MNTDIVTLGLMQLSDSFFPTGTYTMSHGLEMLHRKKIITTPEQTRQLIEALLSNQVGPADCVALNNSYDCAKEANISGLVEIDWKIHRMRLVQTQREASARAGGQLIKCVIAMGNDLTVKKFHEQILENKTPGTYPVCLALAGQFLGISKNNTCLALMYGFTVGVLGAAMRLGIIQHTQSQQILSEIRPIISEQASMHSNTGIDQMWQFIPYVEIFQMHHEKLESKMFVT
ncbi:MAG: urease accessory protein [Thaumarchaeota archaeon]|nr:urease accessory protein [Nitrososphaerota archaeon]